MSDFSYRFVRRVGLPIVWLTTRPVVLLAGRVPRTGGVLIAANHHSPYDVAALVALVPRPVDFLSIVEFRDKAVVGPFFRAMNCCFVDRRRRDLAAVRAVLARLAAGRAVGLFPEAGIRTPDRSVTSGGPFNPGVVRLAQLSRCPIVPVVVLNTGVYSRFTSYLPTRSAAVGIAFGRPIDATDPAATRDALAGAFVSLASELQSYLPTAPQAGV